MSYAQEDGYFGFRNSLTPNTHFLPLLLKAGEEILDNFWSLVPSPTSKTFRYPKEQTTACTASSSAVPCQQHSHSCEQQGPAPVPALPHRPAPAQHSLMTRSVFSNNTTFFSVEIINICTARAWPVRDKPLEGSVHEG